MKSQDLRRQSKSNKHKVSQVAAKKLFAEVQKKSALPYSAFKASAKFCPVSSLLFAVSNNNGRELTASYSLLTSMTADSRWNTIVLKFSNPFSIIVSGHNLQPLYKKLLRHEVEWIKKFDRKIWKAPRPDEPCVLGIEVRHALH